MIALGVSDHHLLASAVAGQALSVRRSATDDVHLDGEGLVLPLAEGDQLVAVSVQAALLGLGSLEPHLLHPLVSRPRESRQYVTAEAARAVDVLGSILPRSVRGAIRACWAGPACGSADESLQLVLGGGGVPPAPADFGALRPRLLLKQPRPSQPLLGGADQRRAATPGALDAPAADDEGDDTSGAARIRRLVPSLPWNSPLLTNLFKAIGAESRARRATDSSDAELPFGKARASARGGGSGSSTTVELSPVVSRGEVEERCFSYPMWDGARGHYRGSWCQVHELDVLAGAAVARPAPPNPVLRRQLAVLGTTRRRHDRQADGDDLDPSALVQLAVDRAAGEQVDERVYSTMRQTARDLGVVIVVDASGSTSDQTSAGEPVWDRQRELAGVLAGELERVGDRVAVYGFRSWGRHHVNFLRIKGFDDRFDERARRRLRAVEPGGFTHLGAAVRHAAHVVERQAGTGHRLLVLLSDGLAFDNDYRARLAEGDTSRALKEAAARGVACVCVSLGAPTDAAALGRTWAGAVHARLDHDRGDEDRVVPLFAAALRAVASRGASGPATEGTGA